LVLVTRSVVGRDIVIPSVTREVERDLVSMLLTRGATLLLYRLALLLAAMPSSGCSNPAVDPRLWALRRGANLSKNCIFG
jgi:hypothetical protein